jgi:hypothetical protein
MASFSQKLRINADSFLMAFLLDKADIFVLLRNPSSNISLKEDKKVKCFADEITKTLLSHQEISFSQPLFPETEQQSDIFMKYQCV